MLKNLRMFLLAVMIFPVQIHAYAHTAEKPSKGNQPPTQTSPVTPQQPDRPSPQREAQKQGPYEVRVVSTPAKDRYDKAAVWINLGLAIVGLFGIGIALATLRKIERQIRVAAADTQAMIRAERGWLVPSVKEIESGVYVFSVKNAGKTPAKVETVYCGNLWQGMGNPSDKVKLNLPDDGTTALGLIQFPPFLLPPGAKKTLWRLDRTGVERISGGGMGEQSNFARGFGMARIFGRIRYRNVLDEDPSIPMHETRFLYILIPQPGTIPVPDPFFPEYNTYS